MQLIQSQRKHCKIKMALQGCSGSGKTFSSLLLAKGLANGDFSKVAVIDSERGSSNLYAGLGNYKVLTLPPPYMPETYIKAIEICEKANMEVIILDGISNIWKELLDFHSKLSGNSFINWGKVNPRLNAFINKVFESPCHIIATMRTKQAYVLNLMNGKYVPEKVGLKAIMRDGIDFEFDLVFDVDGAHQARALKDRTRLFKEQEKFMVSSITGSKILKWASMEPLADKVSDSKHQSGLEMLKVLDRGSVNG